MCRNLFLALKKKGNICSFHWIGWRQKPNARHQCLVLLQVPKFFVPDQIFIYILYQSQTFCARQKDDLHSVKLVFVPAQKF